MIRINYLTARSNLKHYMEYARTHGEPVIIEAKDGNSVLMSDEEYNNLMENIYIRSDPKLMEKITRGLADLSKAKMAVKK